MTVYECFPLGGLFILMPPITFDCISNVILLFALLLLMIVVVVVVATRRTGPTSIFGLHFLDWGTAAAADAVVIVVALPEVGWCNVVCCRMIPLGATGSGVRFVLDALFERCLAAPKTEQNSFINSRNMSILRTMRLHSKAIQHTWCTANIIIGNVIEMSHFQRQTGRCRPHNVRFSEAKSGTAIWHARWFFLRCHDCRCRASGGIVVACIRISCSTKVIC